MLQNKFVVVSSGILAGLFLGLALLFVTAHLNFSPQNNFYTAFGIKKHTVIGFLPYWLLGKANTNYDASLTTLTYFGLSIDTDGHIQKLVNSQEEEPGWTTLKISKTLQKKLTDAKNNHETISLLLHQSDEASITELLKNPKKSADNLLADTLPVMEKYGFSDLNLDIESFQKADSTKQQAFLTFLTEVKKGLKKNETLTIDIAPIAFVKQFLIDPKRIEPMVDTVVVMAYDYHYSGSFLAGPVAPLATATKTDEFDVVTAVDVAKKIIPAEKLVLGIPLYGYEWASIQHAPNSPVIPASGETASNRRLTDMLKTCTNCQIIPNALAGESEIVYQDTKDMYFHQIYAFTEDAMEKHLAFAEKENVQGIALWALGYEGNSLLTPVEQYKQQVLWK